MRANGIVRQIVKGPVNVLLVFVPLGIVAGEAGWDATTVFTLNFLAIIPLAAVLSFATEQISDHVGETFGGLLNATFGNAVELIVSNRIREQPPCFSCNRLLVARRD